jgi:cytoskeletal protein CcmA (bactofilin family)
MVFQRKHDPKTLTVVPAEVSTLSASTGSGRAAESVIGKDMSIEGQSITVRCRGSLRVNGAIAADLHCAELVVGEQAVVNGSIAADSVRVFGQVHGAILGSSVVLHPSAQVEGDIHSQSLTIEQGASFDGRSRKVTNAAEVAPQLETPAQIETDSRIYG